MERIKWHSYRVSLAISDHTVLPATQHKWTHPALIPARQAGTQLTYPGGMEGWVDLGDLLHVYRDGLPTCRVTHPSTNRAQCRLTTLIEVSHYSTGMLIDVGALQLLWLLSGVLWMSEGNIQCIDELNICYELFGLFMNHSDAGTFCRNRNGILATVPDNKTQHHISHLLRSAGNHDYWIGGKLDVMELTWVDGTTYLAGQWKMCHLIFITVESLRI